IRPERVENFLVRDQPMRMFDKVLEQTESFRRERNTICFAPQALIHGIEPVTVKPFHSPRLTMAPEKEKGLRRAPTGRRACCFEWGRDCGNFARAASWAASGKPDFSVRVPLRDVASERVGFRLRDEHVSLACLSIPGSLWSVIVGRNLNDGVPRLTAGLADECFSKIFQVKARSSNH